MFRHGIILAALVVLAACTATDKKDYNASASCQALGYVPGNADYEKCVREEKSIRMMEEQRKEYEDMKQQQEDWKLRRY